MSTPPAPSATESGNAPTAAAKLRPWLVRIVALGLLAWVLQEHGGTDLVMRVMHQLGARWPLLLLPWIAATATNIWAYNTSLPGRGKDAPTGVLLRIQLAGGALNQLLPLGGSSSNIMKVGLLRHWYSAEALVAAGIWGSLATGIGNTAAGLGPLAALVLGYGEVWLAVVLAIMCFGMGMPAVVAVAFVSKGLSERVSRWATVLPFAPLTARRQKIIDWAARLDVHLASAIGERRADFRKLVVLRALFQVIRVLEIWLAIELLQLPGGLLTALLYNAMSRSVRQIVRVIPGQVGVMEVSASAMFVGLGLDAEMGVALALALRVRYLAGLLLSFGCLATVSSLPERYPPRSAAERAAAGMP